jgi:hypothetical protein
MPVIFRNDCRRITLALTFIRLKGLMLISVMLMPMLRFIFKTYYATSRKVAGSIHDKVIGFFN